MEKMDSTKSERPITLLRAVQLSIKRLDHIYNNGQPIKTIFSYEAYGQRLRLKETLLKLLFTESNSQVKRCEELIWRKVFYEPLQIYKLHIKNKEPTDRIAEFELTLKMHILSGIGYYQSLLLQLQSESSTLFGKDFYNWLPVTFHIPVYDDYAYNFDQKYLSGLATSPLRDRIVQKCLMYIGDLFRYLMEFGNGPAKCIAYAYYAKALNFDPGIGLLHNQLGILDVGSCYGLNAIFHYLLCLGARIPFEGAQGNLSTVLYKSDLRKSRRDFFHHPRKYHPRDIRYTIKKFIFVIQQFLKPPTQPTDVPIASLFQETVFELHLMLSLVGNETLDDVPFNGTGNELDHLTSQLDRLVVVEESSCFDRYHDSCPVFSNQLTGPIFVRILMIALLTANCVESRSKCTSSARKGKAKEGVTSATSDQPEARGGKNGLGETSDLVECEAQQDKSLNSTAKDRTIYDPYGPLAFLLSLTELYMLHCSIQIADLLESLSNGAVRDSTTLEDLPKEEATADKRPPSAHGSIKAEDGDREHKEETSSVDVGSSDWSGSSSEDDSDENFHIGRLQKKVQEHEDFERSDGEYWNSDDSSIFHSQDELDSLGSSASDTDDHANLGTGRKIVHDHRFQRQQRLARGDESKVKEMTHEVTIGNASSVGDATGAFLNPIQEEDSSLMPRCSVLSTTSMESSEEDMPEAPECILPTSGSKKHSMHGKTSLRKASSSPTRLPGPSSSSSAVNAFTPTPASQLSVVARIFLLAPVKVVLDWLVSARHGPEQAPPVGCLPWLTTFAGWGQPPELPEAGHAAASACRWSMLKYWCHRLAFLLSSLMPVVGQLETELLPVSAPDAVSDGPGNRLLDKLTPFGITALRRLLQSRQSVPPQEQVNMNGVQVSGCPAEPAKVYPLPEDWLLRGLASLTDSQAGVDYEQSTILPAFSQMDEAALRATQLVMFGRHLAEQCAPLGIPFKYVSEAGDDEHNSTAGFRFQSRDKLRRPSAASRDGGGSERMAYTYRRYLGCSYHYFRPSWRWRPTNRFSCEGGYRTGGSRRGGGGAAGLYRGGRAHPAPPTRGGHEPSHHNRHQPRHHQFCHADRSVEAKPDQSQCRTGDETLSSRRRDSGGGGGVLPLGADDRDVEVGKKVDSESRLAQAMRDMARLRLLDEVDHLSRQCCRSQSPQQQAASVGGRLPAGSTPKLDDDDVFPDSVVAGGGGGHHLFVSPYLVLDTFCLTGHLSAVKQMVRSGAFVVLVPTAVIAHLDFLKKTMATARGAIRYLEQETQGGNRYLRLQRPEEQLPESLTLPPPERLRHQDTGSPEPGQAAHSESVDPRVVKRWLGILEYAVYVTQNKKETHPSGEEPAPPEKDIRSKELEIQEEATEVTATGSTCCNLLQSLRTEEALDTREPQNVLATILMGSRDLTPEEVTVPKQFVRLVHRSGVRLELLRDFFPRWRRNGRMRQQDI